MSEEKNIRGKGDLDGDGYVYDFFKYMTSVSLLSLGGLFTFFGMKTAEGVPDLVKAAAAVVIGLAAFLSYHGATLLVEAKSQGQPLGSSVYALQNWAPRTYGVGFAILAYICGDIIR